MKIPDEIIATILVAAFGSTGLWTVINQIITALIEKRKAKQGSQEDKIKEIIKPTNDMVLGLGYDRLIHVCNKHLEKGWIDPVELKDITKYLYLPYRSLGGNGTAEMLFDKVTKLPNTPSQEGGKENV